jgi:hypothetical protein
MASMTHLQDEVRYFGYEHNLRLDNGRVELIIPTEFGPRVMRYGFVGRSNVLAEISPASQSKPTPYGDAWHIYGGHRLWVAPEHAERSYYPDNRPVRVERVERGVRVVQAVETHSGLEKSLSVELAPTGSHVVLRHRLLNRGCESLAIAPWSLSAMAPTGRAIFPHPPFVPHPDALAPARPLVLWPFTRMNDARFTWGDRFFSLQQDPRRKDAQKVGLYDPLGYMAYAIDGQLFIKRHHPKPGAHADFGCNVQTFTNELFLELETLGPIVVLAPKQQVEHDEHWFLFDDVKLGTSEAELESALAPLLAETERELEQSRS